MASTISVMTPSTALGENHDLDALQAALVGRYIIERELGRGGMGTVYLARDVSLDRLVALKVLPAAFMAQHTLRERFLRETRLVAGMSHPNVVPVHAVEEHPGVIFYAMGFIDGDSLTDRVRRAGPLPPAEVGRVMQEAAWALSYAHGRGVVHRDVKPDNILIERATGRALLVDFGISRVADSTITSLGESLGTPQFMSPEQAAGEPADPRSDLYSLGIVGFFALTGRVPFDAPTVQAILAMQVTKPAPPVGVARPGTPFQLAAAIDKCLAKTPDERWPSAEALVSALQQVQGTVQDIAPPVRNFQRVAEMSSTTVISLFVLLPAVAVARPEAADLLLMVLVVFTVVNGLQLATRAQALRDQGFGYDDVRAAFDADKRVEQETANAPIAPQVAPPGAKATRGRLTLLAGLVMFGAGVALASRVHVQTKLGTLAVGLLVLGLVLLVIYVMTVVYHRTLTRRGPNRLAVRLWMSGFGRLFFRVVASPRGGRNGAIAQAATGSSHHGAAALLSTLPPRVRKQLSGAAPLVAQLEDLVSSLDARARELSEALGELGDGRSAATDDTATTVADSRAALATDLRHARDSVVSRREAALAALEDLRLCFLRLRTGIGTPDDGRAALARARTTMAASESSS
ncbi:MAG TPA: serine/threonine-protein kinase [Gemmatimonadaceae bacterium]